MPATQTRPTRRVQNPDQPRPETYLAALTDPRQVAFYVQNVEFALAIGVDYALWRFEGVGRTGVAHGLVDTASTEGLAKVARQVTDPGATPNRGRVRVYVKTEIRTLFHRAFGYRGQRHELPLECRFRRADPPAPDPTPREGDDDRHERDRREAEDADALRRLDRLTGGLVPRTYTEWRRLARSFGVPAFQRHRRLTKEALSRNVMAALQARLDGVGIGPEQGESS